jgi:hypothetical protein
LDACLSADRDDTDDTDFGLTINYASLLQTCHTGPEPVTFSHEFDGVALGVCLRQTGFEKTDDADDTDFGLTINYASLLQTCHTGPEPVTFSTVVTFKMKV